MPKKNNVGPNLHTIQQLQKESTPNRFKVGVALCGGIAYGVAQIGVLKALEQAGIQVDCVAGTSAGAIIAAAYASGLPVSRIEEIGINTNWGELFSFRPSRSGLVSSGPIEEYIHKYLKVATFDELKKPLVVVATDICSGQEVVFSRGPLDKAVRASCTIPGIYSPVVMDGCQLVDGGMSENVPVKALKALGADVVIAVNVFGHHQVFPPASNVFQILMRVWYFFVREQSQWREDADVLIEPDLRLFDLFDFSSGKKLIDVGEKEAKRQMPKIKQVIQRRFYFRPEIYR
ncbi:MAG: patatin-like phospholipase family protein [bacterium]